MAALCEDFGTIKRVFPSADGCEECLALGDSWIHLRMCLYCGKASCCDASPNKHASKHFLETGHPVIRSLEPGEDWIYCYRHDIFADDLAIATGEET